MPTTEIDERHVQSGYEIAELQVSAQGAEAADLTRHHERLDLALQTVSLLVLFAFRSALSQSLDFDLTRRLRDPLGRMRLARAEEDLRGRLRQHGFRVVSVPSFELAAPLEAQDDRIVRLSVFGDGGMELRQPLQTRQFIEHEPHRTLTRLPKLINRSTSMSSHKLVTGTRRRRGFGVLGRNR